MNGSGRGVSAAQAVMADVDGQEPDRQRHAEVEDPRQDLGRETCPPARLLIMEVAGLKPKCLVIKPPIKGSSFRDSRDKAAPLNARCLDRFGFDDNARRSERPASGPPRPPYMALAFAFARLRYSRTGRPPTPQFSSSTSSITTNVPFGSLSRTETRSCYPLDDLGLLAGRGPLPGDLDVDIRHASASPAAAALPC